MSQPPTRATHDYAAIARGLITTTRLARLDFQAAAPTPPHGSWPVPRSAWYQPIDFTVLPMTVLGPLQPYEDAPSYLNRTLGDIMTIGGKIGGVDTLLDALRMVVLGSARPRLQAEGVNIIPGGAYDDGLSVDDMVLRGLAYGESLLVEQSPAVRKSLAAVLLGGYATLSGIVAQHVVEPVIVQVHVQNASQGMEVIAVGSGAIVGVSAVGVLAVALALRLVGAAGAAEEDAERAGKDQPELPTV